MSRIYIQNNLCHVPSHPDLSYIPKYYSLVQKEFFIKRFDALQNHCPQAKWCEHIEELKQGDIVFAWDAYDEQKVFSSFLNPIQNRLLSELNFDVPDSFTGFRKKAEKVLPSYYQDAIAPYDQEVIGELNYYFGTKKLPSSYFKDRNGLLGRDYSSKLSPYLACGALDVRYLYNCIKDYEQKYGANKSTYWLVFELLWREFFYWHYQKHGKKYFSKNGLKGPLDFSPYPDISMDELKAMDTQPFFQAALNELEYSGFMSNRMRQLFASYWLNELGLNWRSGAMLFEMYLIDYDVYSNYGNWMYLAGVGVDPRGKRHFHIEKQLKDHDPDGAYIKCWLNNA